jgi:phospholipase/carboxylesterase
LTENNSGPNLTGTKLVEDAPLTYLLRWPSQDNKAQLIPILLMLHGWGGNERDIYQLVPDVDKRVMIVAPRAPLLARDDSPGSFKWFETLQLATPSPASLKATLEKLVALIKELDKSSGLTIDRKQLYIAGFSQGALMSYFLAGAHSELVAGVIAHSSPFSQAIETHLRQHQSSLVGKPFFVAHGTCETQVPLEYAHWAIKTLKEVGAEVTYREFPLAHQTSVESRQVLAEWLNSRLKF